jgi:guanylate kinase
VLEIDVQGATQIVAAEPSALLVLVTAPSEEAQIERLRGRGDPEEQVQRRVELGRREVEAGRQLTSYEVVNSDIETSVSQLMAIINDARSGVLPRP